MKKLIALLSALVCILGLAACSNNSEKAAAYSFRGEHEYFAISNGSILLRDKEEVFDGGDLKITQLGVFEEIASYSVTFYTRTDGAQRIILCNRVVDQTGGTVHVEGDLGQASGKGILFSRKIESMDDLRENLWFELKTTDLSGVETVYEIQLTVTE